MNANSQNNNNTIVAIIMGMVIVASIVWFVKFKLPYDGWSSLDQRSCVNKCLKPIGFTDTNFCDRKTLKDYCSCICVELEKDYTTFEEAENNLRRETLHKYSAPCTSKLEECQ